MPYARSPRPASYAALDGARPVPFWLDSPLRPAPLPALQGSEQTDLLVVGAGFTGLWTAVLAKQADKDRDVVVVEAGRVGWAASGRNGGFCAASITHGFANGLARWPQELELLTTLGNENLAGIAATIAEYQIDCSFETSGELSVATEPYQVAELAELVGDAAAYGETLEWLDADAVRESVDSPLFLGAVRDRTGVAMVDPARLAWGLRRVALELGVRVYEGTRGVSLDEQGAGLVVATDSAGGPGSVTARRVALGTNAFPPLLRRLRHYLVPVYDYAVMTEPLPEQTWAQLGWAGREGIGDSGNQFHYTRRTDDGRILYGGYDAVYHRGGMAPAHDQRPETFALLVEHLVETFPVLEGVRMSHAWGGAIDTCSRFSPFMGTARDGRVAYAAGYTGLGVGASRFGAAVMLDLLEGRRTERTATEMVRTLPLPFPPEPLRWAGIELTRWSLDRADRHEGRRNLWLRTLDRLGMGFDS